MISVKSPRRRTFPPFLKKVRPNAAPFRRPRWYGAEKPSRHSFAEGAESRPQPPAPPRKLPRRIVQHRSSSSPLPDRAGEPGLRRWAAEDRNTFRLWRSYPEQEDGD
jgi:hypothetical protein